MIKKFLFIIFILKILISSASANFEIKARTVILQDYFSGEILYEKNADASIYPASMTKIMTAIVAFDLIKSGDLSLDDNFIDCEVVELPFYDKDKLIPRGKDTTIP